MTVNYPHPRISSLSGSLINQIAAGEVIERPSSVVKELIENAIDSGATKVEIHIDRGGTERIIISDNGCGIHPDDLELAIRRHTTSKLHDQDGLNTITSLGFRGEALSSIASVSDFSITSRIETEENAMKLVFDPFTSGLELSPSPANTGTTVEVLKLFQPVPARRKFLRSAKTEFLHTHEIIKRFVMGHCDIDFIFYHNGKQILKCLANESNYRERISAVFGSGFYENAWFVDNAIDRVRIWGWVGNEKTFRNQSNRQYLYLNQRIIKDRHISHAVRKAMDELVHESRFPSYILFVEVDPSDVDVNVHPTKQEVRFRTPRTIHDYIYAVVRQAINTTSNNDSLPGLENLEPTQPGTQHSYSLERSREISDLKATYGDTTQENSDEFVSTNPFGRPIALIKGNILLASYGDELRIIDYTNLKKRYLVNILSDQINTSGIKSRSLLVPLLISLDDRKIETILSCREFLKRLGIEITQSGPHSIKIRSVPTILPGLDLYQTIADLVDNQPNLEDLDTGQLIRIIEDMVDNSLMNDNQKLLLSEVQSELGQFASLDLPFKQRHCPGFWKTVTNQELKKLIKNSE